ncbi:MAG: hypothetical protein ACLQVM_15805 [Terriglobia bacterium]
MSVIPAQPYSVRNIRPIRHDARIGLFHFLLLAALALSVTVWGATLIAGARGYELEKFISLVGFFGVACVLFVASRMGAGFQGLFEIPVFMTVLAFVEFGAAPIGCFFDPDALPPNFHGDTSFLQPALVIVIAGMGAFWLGSAIARSWRQPTAVLDLGSLPGSAAQTPTLALGACLYLAAFGAKVYMLRSGWFGFLQSINGTNAHLPEVQVWNVISSFGLYALILFRVEAYYHRGDKLRAMLFWAVLACECFWGLISGMKSMLLFNLVAVALVSSMAGRKLKIRWLALVILGLIAIYPLINQYRAIVRRSASDATTSVSAAAEAMEGAVERGGHRERTAGHWLTSGWSSSLNRFDMLQNVALLLAYQDQSYLLAGEERLWMIPYYPFVPRILWRGKPVDDMGLRFTKLLGGGAMSCSSPTIPGDLYVCHHGLPAVLVGMFLVGLVAQLLTNPVKLCPSKRNLFIYACVFFAAANWEGDFFSYATLLIRSFVVVQILAWIMYGPGRGPSRVGMLLDRILHRW